MPENYRNAEQDRKLIEIEGSIKVINRELGDVRTSVVGIATTQKIILGFIMIILTGIAGLFLK